MAAPTPFSSVVFYVYILKSRKDSQLYTGYTADLRRRLVEHNSGETLSTRHRGPFDLVYYEAYRAKTDAQKRERMLKLRAKALAQLKRRIQASLFES